MKPETSKPVKYAETIGRHKYTRLSSSRQHEYLALLARDALESGNFPRFFKRYREMQSWVDLDQYDPPEYLSDREAVVEFLLFHNSFTGNPVKFNKDSAADLKAETLSWSPVFDVTVVLDQVRSPYNTGSVLRLIDNFGFKGLVHNSDWLRLDHPQLAKAARGTQKWIPADYKKDLYKWLMDAPGHIIGLEKSKNSIRIEDWSPDLPCVLVLGNEVYGIAENLRKCCDTLVEIPMFGFKESMNLNHALAIAGQKITYSCS